MYPCDSPKLPSGSSHSVSIKPSTTISASAGTIKSTVLALHTRIGDPTSPPATASSSRCFGSLWTDAKVIAGGAPSKSATGIFFSPRALNFSQCSWMPWFSSISGFIPIRVGLLTMAR